MKESGSPIKGSKTEKQIIWIISILTLLLASDVWKILDERWDSLNNLPVSIYTGILFFYLLTERIAYKGSDIKGKQSGKWTRYFLLFFWELLLIVPVLEYSLYTRENFTITISGSFLTILGTGLRMWGMWTLGKYFSVHIEIKGGHKLVESGPYKFIRHPAYAGNIIQALGIPLILNAYLSLSISTLLIILFLYRLKLEEEVLIREVKGYENYVKRTDRLIPKVW